MKMSNGFIVMRGVSGFRIERSCFGFPRIMGSVVLFGTTMEKSRVPCCVTQPSTFLNQSICDHQIPTTYFPGFLGTPYTGFSFFYFPRISQYAKPPIYIYCYKIKVIRETKERKNRE